MWPTKNYLKGFLTAAGLAVVLAAGFAAADGLCTDAAGCGGSIFGGSSGGATGWPTDITGAASTNETAPLKIRGTGGQTANGANFYQHSGGVFNWVCVIAGVENACDYVRQLAAGKFWSITDSGGNNLIHVAETGAITIAGKGPNIVRKTADDAPIQSDITPNNDDELFFAVAANSFYRFRAYVLYSSDATADFRIDFAVPAGASGRRADRHGSTSITSCQAANSTILNSVTVDAESGNVGGGGTASVCVLEVEGVVATAGTAGNVTFMWAQATSQALDTTVYANSYIVWQRM